MLSCASGDGEHRLPGAHDGLRGEAGQPAPRHLPGHHREPVHHPPPGQTTKQFIDTIAHKLHIPYPTS